MPDASSLIREETLRQERREASYPEPFPTGWYVVTPSKALDKHARKGRPMAAELLGQRVVVFRDAEGRAHVLDGYCPHLGADLSAGKVCEGKLECPFHGWQFEGDGQLAAVPYLKEGRTLPTISAGSHPVLEQDGMVMLWHGSDAPDYGIPEMPSAMKHRGDHDAGVVKMHLQEFAENSVDFAHFAPLHGQMRLPWLGWPIPGLTIAHEADWVPDEAHPWIARFHDSAVLRFRGKTLEKTKAKATITFHGPGSVVHFRFAIPDVGDIVMIQTHTPIAPLAQRVRFRWFADPSIPRLLVSYVVGNWVSQWREDIDIWENKIFRERPQLVRDDGPVHKLRKWYRQFRR